MNCQACHLPIDPDAEEFVNVPGSGQFHGTCRPSVPSNGGFEIPSAELSSGFSAPAPAWPPVSNPWSNPQTFQEPAAPPRGWVDASFLSGGRADDPDGVYTMSAARAPWNRNRPRW